jgi:hypothetical protein
MTQSLQARQAQTRLNRPALLPGLQPRRGSPFAVTCDAFSAIGGAQETVSEINHQGRGESRFVTSGRQERMHRQWLELHRMPGSPQGHRHRAAKKMIAHSKTENGGAKKRLEWIRRGTPSSWGGKSPAWSEPQVALAGLARHQSIVSPRGQPRQPLFSSKSPASAPLSSLCRGSPFFLSSRPIPRQRNPRQKLGLSPSLSASQLRN